mgnify:CR=1 FL=1
MYAMIELTSKNTKGLIGQYLATYSNIKCYKGDVNDYAEWYKNFIANIDNPNLVLAFDIEAKKGAFVSEVMPGSAADKAGLKAGDVITAMNGQAISSFAEMRAKIATSGAGKQIELTYLRDGKSNTAKVTLQSDDQTQTTANSLLPALDGAELNNYDEKGVKGVSIGKIKPNSLAEQRGLKNGDVIIGINRQKVENLGQLRKALDSKPSAIALNIIRGDSNFYLLVQ